MKSIISEYWKTILWTLIMSYLLFSPGNSLPDTDIIPHSDKFVHAILFAILTVVFQIDTNKSNNSKRKIIVFIFVVFTFGCISEYIQYAFIPGRYGNVWDVFSDFVGIIMGLLFYRVFRIRLAKFETIS